MWPDHLKAAALAWIVLRIGLSLCLSQDSLIIELESAEFLRLSHGLILAFVSADPVLGNPIRLA
jgi:hypothetical protein